MFNFLMKMETLRDLIKAQLLFLQMLFVVISPLPGLGSLNLTKIMETLL